MISPSDPHAVSLPGSLPCPGNNCGTPIQVKLTWVEGSRGAAVVAHTPARCPECRTELSSESWDEGLRAVAWAESVTEHQAEQDRFFAVLADEEAPWPLA